MSFEELPRIPLVHAPTPLEPLARLRRALGGPRLWLKRDDCTGLAGGGNKARKLEYLIAEAEARGAGAVITFGALQSNHARQTAAACARRGLRCELLLTEAVPRREDGYERGGNLLLDRLLGARLHRLASTDDPEALSERLRAEHATAGRHAEIVPAGGSNATGALGYVRAALELADQCRERGIVPAAVVHAGSTGGTQAGLIAGFALAGLAIPVIAVNVYSADGTALRERVLALAREVLARLGTSSAPDMAAAEVLDGQLGPGYGLPSGPMTDAVLRLARMEGILLDPVYTGKAMAGLLETMAAGRWSAEEDVVFVHTGGTPALGVYASAFPV